MNAAKARLVSGGLILGLLGSLLGTGSGAPLIKLRVTADNAIVKTTPGISARNLTPVPLDTVLDAEAKQGDWYKIKVTKDGTSVVGYIHEMLVKEITESEAQPEMGPSGQQKFQAEVVAEIEMKLEEDKKLIRRENEPDQALDDLKSLLAKSFNIDDRQKRKEIACELYFWIGLAWAKKGDNVAAVKEFKGMFEVNYAYSVEITKNISDSTVSGLLENADKLAKGLLVDFALQIATEPKEATLKINGKVIGPSPVVYRTKTPKFMLEVEKEGYRTIKEDISLIQAMAAKDYTLERIGRNLAVSSVPPGAQIILDGVSTGTVTDCELPFVAYGPHTIKLVRENYADWEGSVRIGEGDGPVTMSATLTVNTYVYFQKYVAPDSRFFASPKAIAFDQDGSFYIVDESDFKIKKFGANFRFVQSWGNAGQDSRILKVPAGIAVDGTGNVYVSDSRSCCIAKFDKTGKFLKKWGEAGTNSNELRGPTGLAVDAAGDLYVADTNNHRIVKYSPDGVVKKTWGKQGIRPGEFFLPIALTVGPKNEVFVIDRIHLQKFGLDGEPIGAWGTLGSGDGEMQMPMGLCTDSFNDVYVADTGNNRLLKFDPNGKLICQWGLPGTGDGQMTAPVGIAVNGQGHVFIVERDNQRLQEFRTPAK